MTDGFGRVTDMRQDVTVPRPRPAEHEVGIRELRNAGKVMAELVAAGAIGRVTSGGHLVGWLIPATDDEQRAEDLIANGRLSRPVRASGRTGQRPLPARSDVPPLTDTLLALRDAEDR